MEIKLDLWLQDLVVEAGQELAREALGEEWWIDFDHHKYGVLHFNASSSGGLAYTMRTVQIPVSKALKKLIETPGDVVLGDVEVDY